MCELDVRFCCLQIEMWISFLAPPTPLTPADTSSEVEAKHANTLKERKGKLKLFLRALSLLSDNVIAESAGESKTRERKEEKTAAT